MPSVAAGDICTVAKLSDTLTGDTLVADKNNGAILPGIDFPEPNMALAISPKTKSDIDKLGAALHRMTEEDPTLKVVREQATGETLLWGMGDSHVNIALEKIQQKFGAQVDISTPQIPYKETLSRSATANGRFKRQSGGHGQFGDVTIILESLGGGTDDIEFKDEIRGGAISKNYVPAVEKGVRGAAEQGVLAGFPTVGFRARLIDGKEHQVDSSDQAFQLAGAMAFREGAANARPTLLEPIHNFEIRVPDSFTGPVIGDLNSRRGRVSGTDQGAAGETVITAEIPLNRLETDHPGARRLFFRVRPLRRTPPASPRRRHRRTQEAGRITGASNRPGLRRYRRIGRTGAGKFQARVNPYRTPMMISTVSWSSFSY